MSIGERIQELRKKKYMSQEDLAEKVDVSKQSVSKWELDKALPNIEKILKLCDIFEVSADYLLRGYDNIVEEVVNNIDESNNIIQEDNSENNKDIKNNTKLKYIIMLICSSILTLFLIIVVYYVVVFNNIGISKGQEQIVVRVDRIYSQFTKADVEYVNSNDEYITKTVYLDLCGANEGDWIFGYADEDNANTMRIKYRQDTCIKLISLLLFFCMITVVLTIAVIRHGKPINKKLNNIIKIVIIIFILVLIFMLIVTGNNGKNTNITNPEAEEIEDDNNNYTDELVMEYKDKSTFSISECEISFSVPDGIFSTGVNDYDDYINEIFYTEEFEQDYIVEVSSLIYYDEPMDYGREIYSEAKEILPASGHISYPQQEVINDNIVTYITSSYEDNGFTHYEICGGVWLSDGRIFEVSSKTIDYDGEFDLDIIRPYFEELDINYE